MTIESTRETMQRYFDSGHSDVSMMANDQITRGRVYFEMPALLQ